MNQDQFIAVMLKFFEYDSSLFWRFQVTPKEYELLKREVDIYNNWIDMLYKGLAPLSSYSTPEDADQWYLASNMIARSNSYSGEFERPGNRGFYEDSSIEFVIYIEGEDSDEEEVVDEKSLEPIKTLINLIIQPLGEESGLGYRILPMFGKVIKRTLEDNAKAKSHDLKFDRPVEELHFNVKQEINDIVWKKFTAPDGLGKFVESGAVINHPYHIDKGKVSGPIAFLQSPNPVNLEETKIITERAARFEKLKEHEKAGRLKPGEAQKIIESISNKDLGKIVEDLDRQSKI